MTLLKILGRLVVGAAVAAFIVYTVALVIVLVVSQQDERRRVDAVVILGAAQYNGRPSPVLRARLDHGLDLWRAGLAPRIIVTGGVGRRGDRFSEAAVGRAYLLDQGVPAAAIVEESRGRSTEASMTAVADWLRHHRLATVLLVSDPFHMARLRLEARRTGLEAYTSPTTTSPISDNPNLEVGYLFREGYKVPVAWVRSLEWFR